MFALTIVLIVVLIVATVVYGRAIAYSFSEEHKMDQRIKDAIRQ